MTQQAQLLSLDEAAQSIGINRRKLSAYVEVLGVQRRKGDGRRAYLDAQDVRTIQEYHQLDTKANPAWQGLIAYSDHPQPVSMPRDYKSYVKEAYQGNDTVYKCVKYITQNGAAIPPKLYTDRSMSKEIKSHPLLDKLDAPNSDDSGVDFREAILGYFLLAGNSYQLALRKGVKGAPDEIWTLQPNRVEIIGAKTRGIVGYKFLDYPDEKNPIDPANIAHMKFWNPDNPVYGMSPLQVGAIMVDQQTAARKWNLGLLQNWARLPGAWTTSTILGQNARQKLEARLNEKFAGARGAGKFPLLDGGFQWTQIGANPTEMDWLQSIIYNAGNLANLYDIPPQLIGDTSSSTYNNIQEAKAASYTEAIFPLLDKLYAKWNKWLLPMYPDLKNAYLYYDKTTVEVVQVVIQQRLTASVQRGNTSYLQGVAMLDEAREMQGLPPLPNGAGRVFRIGAVLVPADKIQEYAEQSLITPAAPPTALPEPLSGPDAQQQKPEQDDEEEKPVSKLAQGEDEDDTDDSDSSSSKPGNKPSTQPANKPKSRAFRNTKALDLASDKDKDAYRKQMETARERWTDEATDRIAKYFAKERKAVVKAFKAHNSDTGTTSVFKSALAGMKDDLQETIFKLWQDVGEDIGGEISKAFDSDEKAHKPVWEYKAIPVVSMVSEGIVRRLLAIAGLRVKGINSTTLKLLQVALADGVAEGESIPQLAKRIDELYLAQIIPNRSTVIARTEVVSSSNWSSHEAAKASGLDLTKVWLSAGDNRVRPTHQDADGQEVGLNEMFEVGGEELEYPGDPNGASDETVMCRCTQIYNRVTANGTSEDVGSDEDSLDEDTEKRRRRHEAKREYREFREAILV